MIRLILLGVLLTGSALAREEARGPNDPPMAENPYGQCDAAIAAAQHGLPAKLLPAISLVEAGRLDPATGRVRAWPWTIDVGGQGTFFATKAQAIQAVRGLQAAGVRSIDVGCLQVNLMHHAGAFPSLEAAFDPDANARYATRFLVALFHQFGTWQRATAAYHSQDAVLGEDYQRRVYTAAGFPLPPRTLLAAPGRPNGPYAAWPPPGVQFGAMPPAGYAFNALSQPFAGGALPGGAGADELARRLVAERRGLIGPTRR